ncbi:MAG: HEAT repeat domain-containing protein [Myxococcota bacterium]
MSLSLRRLASAAIVGLSLGGCDPNWVETSGEIDVFIGQGRWSAVCVALKNDRNDSLRKYAAEKLVAAGDEPVAKACVCERVMSFRNGPYDVSIVEGFRGTKRDDLVPCVLPALDEATGEERVHLVGQIGGIGAPSAHKKMAELAKDTKEPVEVRVAAVQALLPERVAYRADLLDRLVNDPAPEVRAEAAATFENEKDDGVVAALVKAARDDADGAVRAAALKSVVKLRIDETDKMVCDMMMNDPDERVRDRAVRSFKGSKRRVALDCLKKRLLTEEKSGMVRESTMKAIYASPDPYAADILCDAIGPFTRMVVGELPVHKMEGADIVKHQNNRDFERSYECVQKAVRQGGYSCYGRYNLADWLERLGGKAFKPTCKGMDKPGEVSFE